jgi:hypothetical protein
MVEEWNRNNLAGSTMPNYSGFYTLLSRVLDKRREEEAQKPEVAAVLRAIEDPAYKASREEFDELCWTVALDEEQAEEGKMTLQGLNKWASDILRTEQARRRILYPPALRQGEKSVRFSLDKGVKKAEQLRISQCQSALRAFIDLLDHDSNVSKKEKEFRVGSVSLIPLRELPLDFQTALKPCYDQFVVHRGCTAGKDMDEGIPVVYLSRPNIPQS